MTPETINERVDVARALQREVDANRIRDDIAFARHRTQVLGINMTLEQYLDSLEQLVDELERDGA